METTAELTLRFPDGRVDSWNLSLPQTEIVRALGNTFEAQNDPYFPPEFRAEILRRVREMELGNYVIHDLIDDND
jgi:hypothetical protein